MNKILIIAACIVLSIPAFAQEGKSESAPAAGWDAFKASIDYPEIARRAGVQGIVDVAVSFDASGKVSGVKTVGYGIFEQPIRDAVKKAKWTPQRAANGKGYDEAYFTVEFKFKEREMPARRVLVIERENPAVRKDH